MANEKNLKYDQTNLQKFKKGGKNVEASKR